MLNVRVWILLLSVILSAKAQSQTVYVSDSSAVSFRSETPLETIEALNHASTVMINMPDRTVQVKVPVSAFQFQNKLMQEHFNEGYLEPEKFPYATFRGKLSDSLDLSIDTVYAVQAIGMLNVHGIDRVHEFIGKIVCEDSIAQLQSKFNLVLEDHEVKVPGVVFDNIAKQVSVRVYFRLSPFRKED